MNANLKKLTGPGRAVFPLAVAVSLSLLTPAHTTPVPATNPDVVDVRRDATVLAVEQVMPSVVNIATKSTIRDPFERARRQAFGQPDAIVGGGSGVVIDEAGYLLTNDHVVRGADQIFVQFNFGTNVYYEAVVIASDPRRDVALLKLNAQPGEKFRAIKFAREDDLLLGETVLALGNPYGLGGSVTRGILSSKSRIMPKEGARLDIPNWLQTDAPINEGNSGGPLINLRGELIGINVAVVSEVQDRPAQGLGFAIPIRLVEEALADIFPTEFVKAYWFGARLKVGTYPLTVTSVQMDSPAHKGGLKPGDTIVQVNNKVPKSFIHFGELLAAQPDADVTITLRRGEAVSDAKVRLVPEKSVFNAGMIRDKLGLLVEASPNGFVITEVQRDSPAGAAGLRPGMWIRALDGQMPSDVAGMAKMLGAKPKAQPVRFDLVVVQQIGNLNVLRPAGVELVPR